MYGGGGGIFLQLAAHGQQDPYIMSPSLKYFRGYGVDEEKKIKMYGWDQQAHAFIWPLLSFDLWFVFEQQMVGQNKVDPTILPPEILHHILTFVDHPTMLKSVSKQMNAAVSYLQKVPSIDDQTTWFENRLDIFNNAFKVKLCKKKASGGYVIGVELPKDTPEKAKLKLIDKMHILFSPFKEHLKVHKV